MCDTVPASIYSHRVFRGCLVYDNLGMCILLAIASNRTHSTVNRLLCKRGVMMMMMMLLTSTGGPKKLHIQRVLAKNSTAVLVIDGFWPSSGGVTRMDDSVEFIHLSLANVSQFAIALLSNVQPAKWELFFSALIN